MKQRNSEILQMQRDSYREQDFEKIVPIDCHIDDELRKNWIEDNDGSCTEKEYDTEDQDVEEIARVSG